MNIRLAQSTDFFQIRHLIHQSEQNKVQNFADIFTEVSVHSFTNSQFQRLISDKNSAIWVVESENKLIGLAWVRRAFRSLQEPENQIFKNSDYAFLEIFHIDPDYIHTPQLQQSLLEVVKNWADQYGFYHLETSVYFSDKSQIQFFEKQNFSPLYQQLKFTIREQSEITPIFHITLQNIWETAELKGTYKTPSLQKEGFIHCCLEHQIEGVTTRYFQPGNSLVLLEINPDLVQAEIKYETSTNGEEFPHIYGILNTNAVINIYNLEIEIQ